MPTTTTAAAAAAAANGDGSEDYQPAGQAWPGRGEGTTHIGFVQRNACAYVGGEGGGVVAERLTGNGAWWHIVHVNDKRSAITQKPHVLGGGGVGAFHRRSGASRPNSIMYAFAYAAM